MAIIHEGMQCMALAALPAAGKARLRSAAGDEAGLFLQAVPDSQPTVFTDDDFRRALWWRLGLRQAPEGATCRLHAAGADGRLCGQALAGNAEHGVTCKRS